MPKAKAADADKETKASTKKVASKKAELKPTKEAAKPADVAIEQTDDKDEKKAKPELAKAGKRSHKAVELDEANQAKELRKKAPSTEPTEETAKPKSTQKPPRTRIERKGKKYRDLVKQIDKTISYDLDQALDLLLKSSPTKFDATVELHVRLGVDPRLAEQNVRGLVILPSGTGKVVRIAVFAEGDDIVKAKKAGADLAMGDEFLQQLDKEKIDFDVLVSTPAMMPKLGKYAKFLGPRGLMPNPKNNTVTTNVAKAVDELKAGRADYRIDSGAIIHLGVGKVSFGDKKLKDNLEAVFASIKSNKPNSFKGNYIQSIYLTTTMGPSISLSKNVIS